MTAAALAGCGGSHEKRAASSPSSGATPPASAPKAPPRGGRAQLAAELLHALRTAGPHSGVYVYDLTTHSTVFSVRSGVGRPPASLEKLYTSAALLIKYGPDARLRTRVLGTGSLAANGLWRGSLYLEGGGDPTFGSAAFNRVWFGGEGSTASSLAGQIAAHGIRRVSGELIGDATAFDALRGGPSSKFGPDLSDLGGQLSALTYNHGESGGAAGGRSDRARTRRSSSRSRCTPTTSRQPRLRAPASPLEARRRWPA